MSIEEEISGEAFLLELCSKAEKSCAFNCSTREEYLNWKGETRKRLADKIGCNEIKPSEDRAELVATEVFDGYTRDKYLLPTGINLKMPLYVLTPQVPAGKVIIALHGHGTYGKEGIVGNHLSGLESVPYHGGEYALDFVKRGYTVVCPDILGSGERAKSLFEEPSPKTACDMLNNALVALGLSLQGVVVFELMRLTEFALALKSNKYESLGVCGFSGGGLFALWLAAMSDRVDLAVVSGYFHTQRDTCLQSNKCGCNFVPDFWHIADMGELAALAAPSYLYIEVGREDRLNGRSGMESVYMQLSTAEKAYCILGKEDRLHLEPVEGAHEWHGTCYDYVDTVVKGMEQRSMS